MNKEQERGPPPEITDPRVAEIRDRLVQLISVFTSEIPLIKQWVTPEFQQALREELAYRQADIPAVYEDCRQIFERPLENNGVDNACAMIVLINRRMKITNMMIEGGIIGGMKGLCYIYPSLYRNFPSIIQRCLDIIRTPLPRSGPKPKSQPVAQPVQQNAQGVAHAKPTAAKPATKFRVQPAVVPPPSSGW